ncbi:MAG: acylase [Pseudomonadota bacterium]
MFRSIHRYALLMSLLAVAACSGKSASNGSERERLQQRAQRVEIIRDDYGVPHIYAKTDADTVFGLLYAQAEDDFPRIERNYVWAIGRLAEIEGEAAIYSDLRARLYMTREEAKAAYSDAPAWLQALCDAWADGLNYYLMTHPDVKPQLLTTFEPWMPMYFSEGSIGGDIEQIPVDRIAAFYGNENAQAAHAAATTSAAMFSAPGGSNGFAIAGEHTRSGDAMLLINPHTSFYFRGEVHAVSEEGLNAYGAVTWGQFFVYQGFNENTGWMHTSTYVDFLDEFILSVDGEPGALRYQYGNEQRQVRETPVTLRYRDGEAMRDRTFTMYHTHHGPVTHVLDGNWVATRINWDPVNALIQSFTRTKLANYAEFREMMNIRTNSSNNTVFADSEGNIAYFHGNFIPKRDTRFDYSKPVDGSDPATDWQGLHTVDESITLLNPANGWIQNANSTPFTAAGAFSPKAEDYPVYMAPDDENFRGIHAQRLLADIDDLTLDGLIALAHDPYLPGFEQLIPGLIAAWDDSDNPSPELAEPMNILRGWDLKTGADSVAMTLAHFYAERFRRRTAFPEGLTAMEQINFLGTGTAPAERLEHFAATISMLEKDFGSWRMAWGDVNRFQRLSGDVALTYDDEKPSLAVGMANSRWGALADFGARRFPGAKRLYGDNGNSFVAAVEFGDRVQARTILVGGQNRDPASLHFDDQAALYVEGVFKEVAYYRDDVEARATVRYLPGERR